MGVAEVGLRRQLGVEVLMEGEFAAVVEGDRSAGGIRPWAEDLPEGAIVGLGPFVRQRGGGRAARARVSATLEIASSARRLGPWQEAVQLLPAQARAVDEAIDRLVTDAVPRSFLLEPTGDQFPVVALQPVVEILHLSVLGLFRP